MQSKQRSIRVFTQGEITRANRLWMVIEHIELSFSYFQLQPFYVELSSKGIGSRTQRTAIMRASFTATLLSYRKLDEFFTKASEKRKKRYPDDLRADDFGFHTACPPLTPKDSDELSKFVAHFTKLGEQLRGRGFNIARLGSAIYSLCLQFFSHIEITLLDRRVLADRQMLAKMLAVRRQITNITNDKQRRLGKTNAHR